MKPLTVNDVYRLKPNEMMSLKLRVHIPAEIQGKDKVIL